MKILEARISNYRSIKEEQVVAIENLTTLIGPNNSGKTNALKAICTFFGGYENNYNYDILNDLPVDRSTKQTSIIITFEIPDIHHWFWSNYDRLHQMHGTQRENNKVTLYLYYTKTNTPVYSFFANVKRPKDKQQEYSKILRNLVSDLIEKFSIVYIPSEKSIIDLYKQLLAPRVSQKASSILSSMLEKLKAELNLIGKSIDATLKSSGIKNSTIQLEIPGEDMKNIIGEFSLLVTDSVKTSYTEKGRGLQAAIFYASFNWVDERIKEENKIPLWLIEEPESYMHPELAKNCSSILNNLSKKSHLIISTHSMQFLPKNPSGIHAFNKIIDSTQVARFIKYDDACNSLKKSLGLRFSDYYGLSDNNIFFEGKWDVYTFKKCLPKIISLTDKDYKNISSATLIEKNGISFLTGFLRAVYDHVRKEVAAVTVFDGDEAGVKARKELQGFFSTKGGFEATIDFVSVRKDYPLEGVFPDQWIIECHKSNPTWFSSWSIDPEGAIEPFDIKDDKKESYAKYMCSKVLEVNSPEEISRLILVFDAVENALTKQNEKLSAI